MKIGLSLQYVCNSYQKIRTKKSRLLKKRKKVRISFSQNQPKIFQNLKYQKNFMSLKRWNVNSTLYLQCTAV